ncbi:sensor histidine kinase [Janthinobacterium agaricidamnosum]|uniref:histidine kinase n=1 Tax=Janthinobacterium agaricidamnosum NBRC 102515 = DSM 9628 TaxID=1349767 RepID=W0V4I4_9BURK|nr:HAMP domain-containing sensor histidine kinase [Janthinobacterium agaricidamnosum]CDG82485.1 HAMP domain protein [Janthinobacterium agaricidamnosum NBRC 102515 = DSM 9628]
MNLTLSQRLSIAFSVLLLACCGASAWLQIRANDMHEQEVVQGLSRGLAESIAVDTQIMGDDGLRPDALRRLFGRLMNVNPSVEVYLLDSAGKIIGHAAPAGHVKRDRVDLAPLRRLLQGQPLPIQGDDPRSASGRKVFSAAALHAGGREAGYVYVILLGEAHDRIAARVSASNVLRTTLWSMAVVALLGLLAGLMAFRLITRPLRRLTDTMRDFDTNANPLLLPAPHAHAAGRRDEIAVLDLAFSQMAARIGEQWHSLTQLDQDRRELVANISHDLRTPMASLHGYLETLLLKNQTLSADERKRYLEIALSQSRKVGRLAQTLFELARLEHGLIEPEREDFSLSDLIQDVFQKFELQAQASQSILSAVLPRGAAIVNADLGMIERVLTNLIDNAIRHTPPGGAIEVALEQAHGSVQVTVSDSGPGIAPELLSKLFKRPFGLGDERRNGGLGLLIVQRIVQLHQSDIQLLAVEGKGAVFRFALQTPRA